MKRNKFTNSVVFTAFLADYKNCSNTNTHLTALFPGLPRGAGTKKVEPIWILLKQETVSGSGISWAVCKSAPRSIHVFTGRMLFLPPNEQRQSNKGKNCSK